MENIPYNSQIFNDICEDYADYRQTGFTVCGAEDPAVIYLGEEFKNKYPRLSKYGVVRVIDQYVNPWVSNTIFEFSNKDITDEEQIMSERILDGLV